MKAIVYSDYGSPDVLQLKAIKKPVPQKDEVLVNVHAAAINPVDWHFIRGEPAIYRLVTGFPKPRNAVPGLDFAGRVMAIGSDVTQFQPGDEVFGAARAGSLAETVSVRETLIALKPANHSFEEAAAMPIVAFTALQGLRDRGRIQPGQKVLINGASGGVGTCAVQMAKAFGAEVTGVCSTRNVEKVRSLGADQVIDYTQEDFTQTGQTVDLVLCCVGNRSAAEYRRVLNPNGRCVVAGFTTLSHIVFQVILPGLWASMTGNKKISSLGFARPNQKDLLTVKEMLESGKVVPVIDQHYPLSETADAIRYLAQGHARGKVIITMDHGDSAQEFDHKNQKRESPSRN